MRDSFLEREWDDLCARVNRSARYYKANASGSGNAFDREAADFTRRDPPQRYPELLDRVREAAALAGSWRSRVDISCDNVGDPGNGLSAHRPPRGSTCSVVTAGHETRT